MQIPILCEALDGGDLAAVRTKRRDEAAMYGDAIEPDRARAAVAGVATFFDAEPSHLTQESSQALPRTWLFRERLAVDYVTHA
jgi:hypothetical protein